MVRGLQFVFVILLPLSARADDAPPPVLKALPTVFVLSAANFSEHASSPHVPLLVAFVAQWCAHSQRLLSAFDEAAEALEYARQSDSFINGRLTTIDVDSEAPLAQRFGVESYPTIYWLPRAEPAEREMNAEEYRGGRSAAQIADFVIRKSAPLLRRLDSEEAVDAFTASADVTVVATVGASAAAEDVGAVEAALRAVSREVEAPFGLKLSATSDFSVLHVHRQQDFATIQHEGDLKNRSSVSAFVRNALHPPLVPFTAASQARLFSSTTSMIAFLLFDGLAAGGDSNADAKRACEAAASRLLGTALFTTLDVTKHKGALSFFDLDREALPVLVVYDKEAHRRYPLSIARSFTMEEIEQHVLGVARGEVIPRMRTSVLEGGSLEGGSLEGGARGGSSSSAPLLLQLGSAGYEATVLQPGVDVLVLFGARWCTRCNLFGTEMAALSRSFAQDGHLLFAQMDVTEHEVSAPPLHTIPAIYLFRANSTNLADGVLYAGDESTRSIAAFLALERFAKPGELEASRLSPKEEL